MERRFPNWQDLMEHWLSAYFADVPAVIFSRPLVSGEMNVIDRMKQQFGELTMQLVNADFAVLPCQSVEDAVEILRATPKDSPYTLVWNGRRIVSHH